MRKIHFAVILMLMKCLGAQGDSHQSSHECDRQCDATAEPMLCKYTFNVEWYHTMTTACGDCLNNATECSRDNCIIGDGRSKPVMLVNRMLPGPAIRVCHGDTIKVKVTNNLAGGESLTIHWHGILQKGTPFMDGVPMVTQCPIERGQSFTYKFEADTEGTHWWHAHTGMQRGEGIAGALIVKQDIEKDPHADEYDEDLEKNTIFLHDWSERSGMDRIVKFISGESFPPTFRPDNILINGVGYTEDTANNKAFRNVFKVVKDKKYRFRVINNAIQNCPVKITIDNHILRVISTDGFAVAPYDVTHIFVGSGERFDFVLNANQALKNYWFRLETIKGCGFTHNAYLNYGDVSDSIEPITTEWDSNHVDYKVINEPENNSTFVTKLSPKYANEAKKDERINGEPDEVHFIGADIFQRINLQFNNVTNMPSASPLLSQPSDAKETCNPEDPNIEHSQFCEDGICKCVHVIDVKLDGLVDLVIYDQSTVPRYAGHHHHLHGYRFHVVDMGVINLGGRVYVEQIKDLYNDRKSSFDASNLIAKDTIGVPASGYVILRFVADNPGVWLFHCHNAMHSNFGMSVSIRVGYPDLPTPPRNFPTCGSWEEEDEVPPTPTTMASTTSRSIQNRPIKPLIFGFMLTLNFIYQ